MNLDDPFEVQDEEAGSAKKPAAKKHKPTGFCEYCGQEGHSTKRSKKCTAPVDSSKKYRKADGTLLTEPQQSAAEDINEGVDFDSMPLVAMPGEDEYSNLAAQALGEDAWECNSDNESVAAVVGVALSR
jgi:hypothetical protein